MEIGWNAQMLGKLGTMEQKIKDANQALSERNTPSEKRHQLIGYIINDMKCIIELLKQYGYRNFPVHQEFTQDRLRDIAKAIHNFLEIHFKQSQRLRSLYKNLNEDREWLRFCRVATTTVV